LKIDVGALRRFGGGHEFGSGNPSLKVLEGGGIKESNNLLSV